MRRKLGFFSVCVSIASASLAAFSCAESTDGFVPDAASTAPPFADGSVPDGGGTPTDGATKADAPVVTASPALLNEISPTGEWIEIVATGSTAIDLSNYRVADSEKDGGAPKLEDAVKLPSGTILSPKSYLLVQGGGLDGGGVACPDGGQSYCFNAEFGVSNKAGETIYLLDETGAVVGTAVYPPSAVPSGDSWGRIPSGDPKGSFVATVPTPGAANQAK
jgi:hypothetical protein